MSYNLSLADAMKVIGSALKTGQSFVELIKVQTGITLQHMATAADQILNKLRTTTNELINVKAATGNTKPPIERSLSKSLVLFLYELNKKGGDYHYNDIREIVKGKYGLTVNDYSSTKYWRLLQKSSTANGYWQITERGIAFLQGQLKLSEKVTIQNDQVISANNKFVTVSDFIDLNDNSVNDRLIEKRKDGLAPQY